jgi:hypothetical protein
MNPSYYDTHKLQLPSVNDTIFCCPKRACRRRIQLRRATTGAHKGNYLKVRDMTLAVDSFLAIACSAITRTMKILPQHFGISFHFMPPPPTILLAPLPLPLLMIFLWCYTSLKLQTNACSPPLSTLLPPIHYTILICSPHASQVFDISSMYLMSRIILYCCFFCPEYVSQKDIKNAKRTGLAYRF